MDLMLVLPLLLLVVMMVFMWRSNKKRQAQQQEMRQQLVPGTEVMTQAGIYGTIVDMVEANNVVTIESGPGTQLRVHSATIVNVVTPTVPDDASSLTGEESADDFSEQLDAETVSPTDADTSLEADSRYDVDPESTDDDAADDGRSKL